MTFLYQNHIIIKFKLTFLGKSVNLITEKSDKCIFIKNAIHKKNKKVHKKQNKNYTKYTKNRREK